MRRSHRPGEIHLEQKVTKETRDYLENQARLVRPLHHACSVTGEEFDLINTMMLNQTAVT